MNLYTTLPLGWAAVHTFIAASYFYLLLRRRGGDEYLGFALLSSFLALYAFGCHLLAEATDEGELGVALNMRLYAIGGTTSAFVAFAHQLMGRPRDRVVTLAWVSCVIGMVLTLAGVFVDPADNVPFRATWVAVPPGIAVAASPLIALWAAVTSALGLVTTKRALTRPPDGSDLRLLALGGFLTVPAFFHDVAISTLRIRTFTLLEHASAFGTVLVSWMLLKRFLHTGDELAIRTDELKRTYEERRQIQEELVHQEQLAAVGELSAIIAHEVRNPLAVLKNAVATLRRASHPPRGARHAAEHPERRVRPPEPPGGRPADLRAPGSRAGPSHLAARAHRGLAGPGATRHPAQRAAAADPRAGRPARRHGR